MSNCTFIVKNKLDPARIERSQRDLCILTPALHSPLATSNNSHHTPNSILLLASSPHLFENIEAIFFSNFVATLGAHLLLCAMRILFDKDA
jgi:hypothetical protein